LSHEFHIIKVGGTLPPLRYPVAESLGLRHDVAYVDANEPWYVVACVNSVRRRCNLLGWSVDCGRV